MARKGGNKKRYEKYRTSGHLQINKERKQQKAKKREEYFAKKREEGRAYKYEKKENPTKNVDHRTPLAKYTSMMRKLQNELDREEIRRKQALENKRKQ